MAITHDQRLARRGFVGSSDAPAIIGVDPYTSPLAVYLEKVYDVQDIKRNEAINRGNRYEPVLLDWAQEELGVEIERNVLVRHPTDLICAANLDGLVRGRREGVEAKVTSLGAEWGDPGTDQVPDRVIVQAHHQMYAADLDLVWVPVLLAEHRRFEQMYRVTRNEDLILIIAAENRLFWEEHVLPKIPPAADGPPCLEVVKRIHRIAGTVAPIDAELVAAWEVARAEKNRAENAEEEAKSAMLAALGDAEAGDYGDPAKWLTYYEQSRAGYDVKPTTFRVPRISKKGF